MKRVDIQRSSRAKIGEISDLSVCSKVTISVSVQQRKVPPCYCI